MKCDSLLMPYYELKCERFIIPEIIVLDACHSDSLVTSLQRETPKCGNYQFYHMLTTFSFLVLKALGYLKGVIR